MGTAARMSPSSPSPEPARASREAHGPKSAAPVSAHHVYE